MTETIEGADGDVITMTVAPGRTVQVGNGYKVQKVVANGVASWETVPIPGKHHFTEGEAVSLPRADAMELHKAGWLLADGEVGTRPFPGSSRDPNQIGLVTSELR